MAAIVNGHGAKRDFEVKLKPIGKPEIGHNGYAGFHPGKVEKLEAGHTRKGWDNLPGRPLTSSITIEHDVELVMRDGARLYADIYRPTDSKEKLPFIISWSPFGKKYNGHDFLPNVTWKAGVLADDISGFEKFEGLDPATWCPAGYAIASVDTRGAGDSDGDMYIMGTQDAQDGYDVIEALAKLPYCNGSVGMAGNSHLAISQYFIAAQNPPSLKAIAPWEGCGDLYREQFVRGGILHMSNFDMIIQWILRGKGGVEDFKAMFDAHPTVDEYWKDKRPDMTKIKIPAYIEGSDHSGLHTMGSVRAWLEIDTPHKWLRWSPWQEWHDLWAVPDNQRELMQFFDRFLKGADNDFERTVPKVRMSVLRYGDCDPIENVVYPDYPIPSTDYKEFYLSSNGKLVEKAPVEGGEVRYDSTDGTSMVHFEHTFKTKTRLIGMSKLHVFVSSEEHDDMCVYVRVRKLDAQGQPMFNIPFPTNRRHAKRAEDIPPKDRTGFLLNMGPLGQLRASHRAIDRSKSIHPQYPFHPHDKVEKIPPGTITELEIGIWQAAIEFEAGEGVRVDIFGSNVPYPELANLSTKTPSPDDNKGEHIVHFGQKYPSRVILPLVPVEN